MWRVTSFVSCFFFSSYLAHRDLHSFPTRRSSDLFVGFLESMRLAQPAFGQPVHVHNAEPLVRRGKCVENLSRCVLRAVVNRHHFKVRIIHFHECCKRSGQLFLFVSGAEKNGDSRAVRIRGGREISHPGKAYRSVGNPETVGEPKQRDPSKQRDSQKMHEDWSRRCPQVILARYGKDRKSTRL